LVPTAKTTPESGLQQQAKRNSGKKKLFLEIVDASDRGIIRSILTQLFWAAFQTALSCSAEFNVYHDDSAKSEPSGGIPPARNPAREQFRQPREKVSETEIIDGRPGIL
jgi:hypothetical protein